MGALNMDTIISASQSDFSLYFANQGNFNLHILKWHGHHFNLNEDYQCEISAISNHCLAPDELLLTPAYLDYHSAKMKIHGLISKVEIQALPNKQYLYSINLNSPLYVLTHSVNSRLFQKISIEDALKRILDTPLTSSIKLQLTTGKSTMMIRSLTQYNETDFHFLKRLLHRYGLFFSFIQQEKQVVLVITDQLPVLNETKTLQLFIDSGQVQSASVANLISEQHQWLSQSTQLCSYNYLQPENKLRSILETNKKTPSYGCIDYFGGNLTTTNNIELDNKITLNQLDWQRDMLSMTTHYTHLQPGQLVNIEQGGLQMKQYHIIAVEHFADQQNNHNRANANSKVKYVNQIQLIPVTCPFVQGAPIYQHYFTKILTGKTIALSGKAPYLDTFGRYEVIMDFDEDANRNKQNKLRKLTPYSGNHDSKAYGHHFPLPPKTNVAIAYVNDDINHPVILGAYNHEQNINPVTYENKEQNVFASKGGHTFLLQSIAEQKLIKLSTKSQFNLFQLNADINGHQIKMHASKGDVELFSKKQFTLHTTNALNTICKASMQHAIKKHYHLITKKSSLIHQSAKDIILASEKNINLKSVKASINLHAVENINLQSENDSEVVSQQGDINFATKQQDIFIQHARFHASSKKSTVMLADHISLQISHSGKVDLKTKGLNINAATIQVNKNSVINQ